MPRFSYELQKINVDINNRIETGPVQINDDWPGIFIRGDNAMFYGMALKTLLHMLKDETDIGRSLAISPLYGLVELLASCNINNLKKDTHDRNQT